MKSESEIKRAIDKYADMLQRICLLHLKNTQDAEDIFQNVFLKYAMYDYVFANEKHEKAWLIKVAVNECKDVLKSFYKRNILPSDVIEDMKSNGTWSMSFIADEDDKEKEIVLEAVLSLPEKYKTVIYLYYFEDYSGEEIADITKRSKSSVYKLLSRGRSILREKLGGDGFE